MPVVFTYWDPENIDSFEKAVARYFAVSELTGVSDSEEQNLALTALVGGRLAEFQVAEQAIISDFYVQQMVEEEELPEQKIIYPEKKTGLLYNKLFLFGIGMLVVVVILLIFIFSKIAKEEEEYEWEQPLPREEPGLWTPPEGGGFVEELEELPELPDLGELTK